MILAKNVRIALTQELFQKLLASEPVVEGLEEKIAADLAAKTDEDLYVMAITQGLLRPLDVNPLIP